MQDHYDNLCKVDGCFGARALRLFGYEVYNLACPRHASSPGEPKSPVLGEFIELGDVAKGAAWAARLCTAQPPAANKQGSRSFKLESRILGAVLGTSRPANEPGLGTPTAGQAGTTIVIFDVEAGPHWARYGALKSPDQSRHIDSTNKQGRETLGVLLPSPCSCLALHYRDSFASALNRTS
jgi:hypothetical protein